MGRQPSTCLREMRRRRRAQPDVAEGGDRLCHSGGERGSATSTGGASAIAFWEKGLWTEPPPALPLGTRVVLGRRARTAKARLLAVRLGEPRAGSSLTVFFVDLHQGLVGLLCSCQTVLRLGRGSHQVRPWPAVASPSLTCRPDPQESGLPTRCCPHSKCVPLAIPRGQFRSLPFPDLGPPQTQHALRQGPAPVPAVGVPGPLVRCRQPSGLVPSSQKEGSLGRLVAQAASGPGCSLCWLRTAPVPSPSPAWH